MRTFNTTGPCEPARHYMMPPRERLPDLLPFVDQQLYFVVHAARQTGKTTAMRAFAEELRGQGVLGLWSTLEESRGIQDIERAELLWIDAMEAAADRLPPAQRPPPLSAVLERPAGRRLRAWLRQWCVQVAPTPVVLLLDEVDTVQGPALLSLLSQLRAGFMDRGPGSFPVSVALVGMRDLRDYLTASKDGQLANPGSPFNVKAASITLRNFTAAEVCQLLAQHTQDTGQSFLPEAAAELARITDGQPFLVNALARLCVTELVRDRAQSVTAAHIGEARERLILARTTHLDSLAQRLREPRVAQIVQAALLGDDPRSIAYDSDDYQYVLDLGLVRGGPDGPEAANPIYREVLVRQLTVNLQQAIPRPTWAWATPEGRLDMPALLEAFRQWWREGADVLAGQVPNYPEAVPHLALCAFLQRVVNGGGRVHREFAAGRGAMDLLVEYGADRFAIEVKRVRSRDRLDGVVASGVAQVGRYLDTVGLAQGWLIVFDVRPGRTWEERLWTECHEVGGKPVVVLGA